MNEKIKEIRKLNKMNQQDFSNKIGVSQSTISSIEKGTFIPSTETIIKICTEFDIDSNWLLLNKNVAKHSNEDYIFLEKYNSLSEREKGRIDQIIEDILKSR